MEYIIEGTGRLNEALANGSISPNRKIDNQHPILWASKQPKAAQLIHCFANYRSNVNVHEPYTGLSPVHIACKRGDVDALQTLIRWGSGVNKCDKQLRTPLHLACWYGNNDCLTTLIRYGAQRTPVDRDINTPAIYALSSNNFQMIEDLPLTYREFIWSARNNCTYGIVVCLPLVPKRSKDTAALYCARNGNNVALRECLDYGARRSKPLMEAAKHNTTQCFETCLTRGACPNKGNNWRPLHWVAYHNNNYAIKTLIESGAYVNARTKIYQTPLHIACLYLSEEAVVALCQYGAIRGVRDAILWTPTLTVSWRTQHNRVIFDTLDTSYQSSKYRIIIGAPLDIFLIILHLLHAPKETITMTDRTFIGYFKCSHHS